MQINLYDFDKTIYDGDSSTDFFFFCLIRKPIIFITLPNMLYKGIKYKLKLIDKTELKCAVFKFVKYINVDEMVSLFWDNHKKNLKEFYMTKNHANDIIISASPEFLLNPMKEYLGVLDLIASVVSTDTGEFLRPNCHDEEKVVRLNEVYSDYKVMESYSDSLSDTPILKLANQAFLVKKNKIIPTKF